MDIKKRLKAKLKTLQPCIPDPWLVKIWTQFSPVLENLLRVNNGQADYVCSYYAKDLRVDVEHMLCLPNREIVFFNLYFFQFYLDFMRFSNMPDEESFLHLYSKYLRDYSDFNDDNDKNWWGFFQYQYSTTQSSSQSDSISHVLMQVTAGSIFAILHEYFHINQELFHLAMKMLETEEAVKPYGIPSLSYNDRVELCCDFCSLSIYLSMIPAIQKSFQLTKEEFIESALLALYMDTLHSLLLSYNPISDKRMENTNEVVIRFKNRFGPLMLMAKISQNSKWTDFLDVDFMGALQKASEKVETYMQYYSKTLLQLEMLIQDYNALDDSDKPAYITIHASTDDQIWLLANIDGVLN